MTDTNDMAILLRAYQLESNPKNGEKWKMQGWSSLRIGASTSDLNRLMDEHLIQLCNQAGRFRSYSLSEKGLGVVARTAMEARPHVTAAELMEAFADIEMWDDLKAMIAETLEAGKRVHFLLEGPPACGKSLFLEGIRQVAPFAALAFGSRTSAAGLSALFFAEQPTILLLDEADKMDHWTLPVLLGVMETGELVSTKSGNTRGVHLETTVIAACNSSAKMTPEFLSRFGMHAHFPEYTRDEFIRVCRSFLVKRHGAEAPLAALIAKTVYDKCLGDVRKARDILKLMHDPTPEELERVVGVMINYAGQVRPKQRSPGLNGRLAGL
ncbi:MAG: AAA family ATPase [Dehalococcoidales bacterium]|nr:AAA family ATPase [Dehalococcoidales bacterium]